MKHTQYRVATQSVHAPSTDLSSIPISTPIFLSTNYKLKDTAHSDLVHSDKAQSGESPFLYRRWGNPTTDVVEKHIAQLEGGFGSFVTSSGMGAITTVLLSFLKKGDHVIAPKAVYGGTFEFFPSFLIPLGVEVTVIDTFEISDYRAHIKKNTKLIYGETPCNPITQVLDLENFAKLGAEFGILTVVDSTFGSPYNQQPIKLGVDICLHSATKYLGGHTDVLAGVLTVKTSELYDHVRKRWRLIGASLSPFDAFLLERGIKTLALRLQAQNSNAHSIAQFLEKHPKIERVFYPGLPSHPQHLIAKKQMKGFGGMLSFEVKGGVSAGKTFVESVKLILLAVSLGGVETLVEHAASMTHAKVPREDRLKAGITDGLIRMSVGIEDINDLIEDLSQALEKVKLSKL